MSLGTHIPVQHQQMVLVPLEQLEAMFEGVLKRNGLVSAAASAADDKPKEVTRKLAAQILAEKGYQVTSYPSFNKLLKEHNVEGKKRGKELWYQVADINRIPARS
jgi:hypothetical protein